MTQHKHNRNNYLTRNKFIYFPVISFMFSMIFTLSSYGQTDTSDAKMSFDLGFTRGNNINILPFFRRIKTNEKKEVDILFPFYAYKRNYVLPTKRSYFFPVYWSDSTAQTRDFRLFTTYYPSLLHISSKKSNNIHSYIFLDLAPEINLLEYTKSADGNYLQNNFLFFLWYYNNKIEQRSHLVLFPLYWSFRDKEKSTQTLIPLYLSGTYHKHQGKFLAVT
ncbi:MAG: hypothetical protein CVU05_14035, partial [Bacteroidetes bacterium HGW-Bacteroidetes-21]